MNLEEIKEIIQREGGKIVIVENDRPQLIIMSFEEYTGKMRAGARSQPLAKEEPRINPYSPPRAEGSPPVSGEGLTIDDLPL